MVWWVVWCGVVRKVFWDRDRFQIHIFVTYTWVTLLYCLNLVMRSISSHLNFLLMQPPQLSIQLFKSLKCQVVVGWGSLCLIWTWHCVLTSSLPSSHLHFQHQQYELTIFCIDVSASMSNLRTIDVGLPPNQTTRQVTNLEYGLEVVKARVSNMVWSLRISSLQQWLWKRIIINWQQMLWNQI